MAVTFNGTMTVNITSAYAGSHDLMALPGRLDKALSIEWTNGTGTNQANALFADTRSAAAAVDSLDLYGVLLDAYGSILNFIKIKGLILRNNSVTSGQILTIGGNFITSSVLGGTAPTLKVHPGGGPSLVLCSPIDGYTVTQTTADVLSMDPGAATINYDVILLGTI